VVATSTIGAGVVVEARAVVIGVSIPAGRYVPAGSVVVVQADADALPEIHTGYAMATAGADTVVFFKAIVAARGAASGGHGDTSHETAPAASSRGSDHD
jgi:carbonic anhydrase/acetyltransferase-like protein (isoleucine patch superfamily)